MEFHRDGDRQTRFIRVERRSPPRRSSTRERVEPVEEQEFELHRSRRKRRASPKEKETAPRISRVRSESGNREDVQNQDDVLNDYYGGQTSCRPSASRPFEHDYIRPEIGRPFHGYTSRIYHGQEDEQVFPPPGNLGSGPPPPRPPPASILNPAWDDDSDEESFITSVSRASGRKGLWPRAAAATSKHGRQLQVQLSLVLSRRGQRYLGAPFPYTQGSWRDADLAAALRDEYRRLKVRRLGPLQKLTSYKTIQFVYFLQYRALRDPGPAYEQRGRSSSTKLQARRHGTWQVTARVPITPNDSAEARSAFMYQLRKPASLRERTSWTDVLDSLIVEGAVVDMDIQETFDSIKIYAALFLSVLLSLGVALAYGFAMDGDFSTGFSIASWMITALGFLGAVIAAGEYFGLERPTAGFNTVEQLESGQYVPKDMMPPRLTGHAYR